MTEPTAALTFAREQRTRFLEEYRAFLAIPSISTLSEHIPDMRRAAEWLTEQMRGMGIENVAVLPTARHPVVYGDWMHAPGKPVVLIYGHYDVQPVDPLNEWLTEPFTPTIRGENIYARGASDMKGQVMAYLKAVESLLKTNSLGVNLKFLIEGEEEIGSPSLGAFIDQHRERLACDVVLNADSGIMRPDLPSMTVGLRGLAYFEVWVYGPSRDLHSGQFGGSVHNPAQVLAELIAGMHDAEGHITLPGFYDKVRVLSPAERADLARTPFEDAEWQKITGVPQLFGEAGFTTLERIGARPTLEVNGLLSGFTGEGSKTVLPAKAMAKISMRLVPNQDDKEVEAQLHDYFRRHAPPSVRWEIKALAGGPAVLMQTTSAHAQAAIRALETTFGKRPVFKLEGGSVPVVSMTTQKLGADTVMMGFGLPDDNLHAPNEKQHLPTFYTGIETFIHFFNNLA